MRGAAPVVLDKSSHRISKRDIDPDALKVINRLKRQGFLAYLTGGAVQNLLQGITPKDFDVVTDARPGQIKRRFRNSYLVGRRFRLAHLHFKGGKIIEVSTFRSEPDKLNKVDSDKGIRREISYGSPREDAFRRDITINALYYDVSTESVIDYVQGLKDLAKRRIRVIGEAEARFKEDPVRILRVVRHASRLGFAIDKKAHRAIEAQLPTLASVSSSRLYEELNKDLANRSRAVIEGYADFGLLCFMLGPIGQAYQSDMELRLELLKNLSLKENASESGWEFSLEELYALVLWPWMKKRVPSDAEDASKAMHEQLLSNPVNLNIPRRIRTSSTQIMGLLWSFDQAMRSGRLRWSWLRRPHYSQASRIHILLSTDRVPRQNETFDTLFREAFPEKRSRRRKRRRRRPSPHSHSPSPQADAAKKKI